MSNHDDDKPKFKTAADLLAEIRKTEPDYQPTVVKLFASDPQIEHFKPLDFGQLKASAPPVEEFALYPCLPTQGIAFLYAATGLGKTLFALNMAYAIAGGGEFLKYRAPKPRKILYVDAEMKYSQVHSRIMQIAERQGELDFHNNFLLLTPDKVLPWILPKIDTPGGQKLYRELIDKLEVEVIIFDNLSMLSSFDENKSHEWVAIQDWLLGLRSAGKTVIIVHHAGKDKSGYRGTSRMLDCVDIAISLQPIADDLVEDQKAFVKKFKVVYEKCRLFGGKDALPFEANLDAGFWTYKSMEQTELDKVVELIGLKMTQLAIAKELNCGQSKVAKLVKKARQLGLLRD